MPKPAFRVYLAGPIHGCNHRQIHQWRDDIKQKFAESLEFIDPSMMRRNSSYAIIKDDLAAIENADGILVNMWRESIGSAIGIVHAHRAGRPVAIADPNHLSNATLNFYASAVESTLHKAARALLHILRAESGWSVAKAGERGDERFKREKLAVALRSACRRAKRNSIVTPVLVLPAVIEKLAGNNRQTIKVTSAQINDAVLHVIREFESKDDYAQEMQGLADSWEAGRAKKSRALRRASGARPNAADCIDIASGKSHSTIWGAAVKTLQDIPSENARAAFQTIWQVPGITRIHLAQFNRGKNAKFGVQIAASKTPCVIEGKMFDVGKKGDTQTFQVRVQHDGEKARIVDEISAALAKAGVLAGK